MESHDTIQALLTDYVLGELTAADRRRVDDHLASCASCAAEARELNTAFHSLGVAERPIDPPSHLRTRVLQQIAADAAPAKHLVHRRDRPAPPRLLQPVWLGVAAAAVVLLGGALVVSMRQAAQLNEALSRANAEYAALEQRVRETGLQADLAVAILTAPDMRRIDLAGTNASRDSVGRAYWSASRGLLVVADRLPAPPAGRIYQVWLIGSTSAGPVSAGLIDAPASGRGMLLVPAPQGVAGDTVTVAITDEPPGGLPAPTGNMHLRGS